MKKVLLIFNLLLFLLLAAFSLLHFFNGYSSFIKPLFILIAPVAFIISIIGSASGLNKIDLTFLLLICLAGIQCFLFYTGDILPIVFLISIFFVYKFLISFLQTGNFQKYKNLLLLTYTIVILSEIILFFLRGRNFLLLFFPNSSIFSILLASQLAFIIPIFLRIRNSPGIYKLSLGILLMSGIIVLIKSEGRAGWIGLGVALFFLYTLFRKVKRVVKLLSVVALLGFGCFLFVYKPGSSNGRMLIYKVVVSEISPKELITGIGYGQFKMKYNLLQAQYFSNHDINSKESQLADNTFYAFNDLLQFIIETGLGGLILLVLVFYLFLRFIIIKKDIIRSSTMLPAACCSLICILTAALFSYPLQISAILIQFVICISIISYYGFTENAYKSYNLVYKIISFSMALLIFLFGLEYFKYNISSKAAFDLSRSGFKHKAIEKYRQLNKGLIKEGYSLYQYANELSKVNEPQRSIDVLKQAANYYSNLELYKLMAQNEYNLKNYQKAEDKYKVAVYMIPNRMMSRYEILFFYIEIKDTLKAIYWARSILNMPVKVSSQTTNYIRQRTQEILRYLTVKIPIKTGNRYQ